jgi:hypothetical protein
LIFGLETEPPLTGFRDDDKIREIHHKKTYKMAERQKQKKKKEEKQTDRWTDA